MPGSDAMTNPLPGVGEGPASTLTDDEATPPPDATVAISAKAYDIAICGALCLLGLWFIYGALQMPGGRDVFDPGTFPLIAGGALAALSAFQIVLTLTGRGESGTLIVRRPVAVVLGMLLVLLFPLGVERLGYYLVAVVWVPVFGWLAGIRKPLHLLLATAIVLLLAKGIFEMLLGTPLP